MIKLASIQLKKFEKVYFNVNPFITLVRELTRPRQRAARSGGNAPGTPA